MCATRPRDAHWFLGRALAALVEAVRHHEGAARRPVRVELHAVSRHRGRADAAFRSVAALARSHPDGRRERRGGAAPRGARRAGRRRRDRGLHRGRHQSRRLVPAEPRELQPLRARRGLSVRRRRAERKLRAADLLLHAPVRHRAARLRQALRRAARQRAEVSARAVPEAAHARRISERTADRRSAQPVRLRDAVRGRRRLSGADAKTARVRSTFRSRASSARSSGTMRFPTIRSSCAAAGRSTATIFTRRPVPARPIWISPNSTTTIR